MEWRVFLDIAMFWNWLWWWLQDSMNILKAIELYIFKNYYILYIFNWRIIALHYCLGYAMYQHESAIDIHMSSPSWTSLSLPILWMSEFMASGYLNKTVKKKTPEKSKLKSKQLCSRVNSGSKGFSVQSCIHSTHCTLFSHGSHPRLFPDIPLPSIPNQLR